MKIFHFVHFIKTFSESTGVRDVMTTDAEESVTIIGTDGGRTEGAREGHRARQKLSLRKAAPEKKDALEILITAAAPPFILRPDPVYFEA